MNPIITFKNIYKSYGSAPLIEDLNLEIEPHEFITVVGTSGSGKTTLLKMINGLIKPDSGNLYIKGIDIQNTNLYQLRHKIGYVIQDIGLMPHMTIANNINYVPNLVAKNKQADLERALRLLNLMQLERDILERYPFELSGGQQQRVGIARALANDPEILLMDEPFGAVDEITRKALQEEIIKLHAHLKMTVIFITHDIKEALRLGTKILLMSAGKIVQFGTKEALLNAPNGEFSDRFFEEYR